MGYMRHHAIIVTNWHSEKDTYQPRGAATIEDAHREAIRIGLRPTPVTDPVTNGYRTFFVPPDGSKEGWEESEAGDSRRDEFVEWLEKQTYDDGSTPLDWAEVQYGDDDGHQYVVRASNRRS